MQVFTNIDDLQKEIDGVWIDYGDQGASFLIGRMGSPANRKAYERAQAKFRSKIKRQKLTADDRIEIMANCLADSILLDWKGLEDMDEKQYPWTRQNAYSVLKFDQDVREFVSEQADLAENFRQDEIEDLGKKSASGSSGKTKTAAG